MQIVRERIESQETCFCGSLEHLAAADSSIFDHYAQILSGEAFLIQLNLCTSSKRRVPGGVGLVRGCYSLVGGIFGCSKVFGCFSSFLVYRLVGFHSRPNLQNWECFGKVGQKAPNLLQIKPIKCFFPEIWFSHGSQNNVCQGICDSTEMVEIL